MSDTLKAWGLEPQPQRVWDYVEIVPETGERTSSITEGNARVLLVNYGLAIDLTAASVLLEDAATKDIPIVLPKTPRKCAGRLTWIGTSYPANTIKS